MGRLEMRAGGQRPGPRRNWRRDARAEPVQGPFVMKILAAFPVAATAWPAGLLQMTRHTVCWKSFGFYGV